VAITSTDGRLLFVCRRGSPTRHRFLRAINDQEKMLRPDGRFLCVVSLHQSLNGKSVA